MTPEQHPGNAQPHRINIEEAWEDFTRFKAIVDEGDAQDFLAVLYAWRDEAITDALREDHVRRYGDPSRSGGMVSSTSADVPTAWTCAAHGVTTTGDCPRCDDELIDLA